MLPQVITYFHFLYFILLVNINVIMPDTKNLKMFFFSQEYGVGRDVSMMGDVYSFGILLLEMFTRKRPTDNMFNDSLNLHKFAKTARPEKVTVIVDPSLLLDLEARVSNSRNPKNERAKIEDCLVAIMRVGVLCSVESPFERMQMTDVVAKLCAARKIFLSNRAWCIRNGIEATCLMFTLVDWSKPFIEIAKLCSCLAFKSWWLKCLLWNAF